MKKDIVTKLTADAVAHRVVGKNLWMVCQAKDERIIVLCLLEYDRKCMGGCWGYKDVTEGMHPYTYDCPLALLEMAPEACAEWREKVRYFHEAKAKAKALANDIAVGTTLELPEGYRPRKLTVTRRDGRKVFGIAEDGRQYRITPRCFAVARVTA